jgi:site-specific DNA-adenine methylase
LQQLEQLEQLLQLQRLQRLQQLQQLERLELTSLDYRDVSIKKNSVVYCDIPYQGTADYGEFNHKEFFDWAATRDFPVYVSEYNIDDKRFELVYTIDKMSLLSANKDKCKNKEEKLYWNRVKL